MNEKATNWILFVICIVLLAGAVVSARLAGYYHGKYTSLKATVDAASAGELQRKYESAIDELRNVQSAYDEIRESVGGLEEVDRRRAEGFGRIYGIISDAGKSASGVASGDQRARIAFDAIARIADELEAEFGGGSE